jgi:hypothetical protein
MSRSIICSFLLLLSLSLYGCGSEGIINPFSGSVWEVGNNNISFSHAVADWDTANNRINLKFDLITGASYPDAIASVEEVSTLTVNNAREVNVVVSIADGRTYACDPSNPDSNATVIFSRLDLNPLGGVSGRIDGMVQRVEDINEPPVELHATFESVPVTN